MTLSTDFRWRGWRPDDNNPGRHVVATTKENIGAVIAMVEEDEQHTLSQIHVAFRRHHTSYSNRQFEIKETLC